MHVLVLTKAKESNNGTMMRMLRVPKRDKLYWRERRGGMPQWALRFKSLEESYVENCRKVCGCAMGDKDRIS